MDEEFFLEDFLQQLEEEMDPEILKGWITSLYDKAHQSYDTARLAFAAEDISGYEYWLNQSKQYSAAFWRLQNKISYLKNRTLLELQWLLEALAPYFSED